MLNREREMERGRIERERWSWAERKRESKMRITRHIFQEYKLLDDVTLVAASGHS